VVVSKSDIAMSSFPPVVKANVQRIRLDSVTEKDSATSNLAMVMRCALHNKT